GFDDRELVGVLGEVGEAVGDPQAGLAVLFPGALRGLENFTLDGAAADFQIDGLAVAFLQLRFVIEEVHLGWAAVHEEEDDGFGFGGEMGVFEGEGIYGGGSRGGTEGEVVALEHSGEGDADEACAGFPEEFAAGATTE